MIRAAARHARRAVVTGGGAGAAAGGAGVAVTGAILETRPRPPRRASARRRETEVASPRAGWAGDDDYAWRRDPVAEHSRRRGRIDPAPAHAPDPLGVLPAPTGQFCFVRRGAGLVGWGEHARLAVRGPDAAARIAAWFADVIGRARRRGRGRPPRHRAGRHGLARLRRRRLSIAVVPRGDRRVCRRRQFRHHRRGRRGRRARGEPSVHHARPHAGPGQLRGRKPVGRRVHRGRQRRHHADPRGRARQGRARPRSRGDARCCPVDERFLLRHLAAGYPDCWTFAVEGLVGRQPRAADPAPRVRHRVRGCWPARPGRNDRRTTRRPPSSWRARRTSPSTSTRSGRWPRCCGRGASRSTVPDAPRPAGAGQPGPPLHRHHRCPRRPADMPTALDLAARLHPTAAVGRQPGARSRGRSSANWSRSPAAAMRRPSAGWTPRGDGEFAIALRCAQIDGQRVRLMAGCGIVADSDPDIEAREAQIKMIPDPGRLGGAGALKPGARTFEGDPDDPGVGATARRGRPSIFQARHFARRRSRADPAIVGMKRFP